MRSRFFAAAALLAAILPSVTAAQSRLRARLGVGQAHGPPIHLESSDTDVPTLCDRHLNPDRYFTPRSNPDCGSGSPGEAWGTRHPAASGELAIGALGYALTDSLVLELEALAIDIPYDTTASVLGEGTAADKGNQELVRAEQRISALSTRNVFANLLYEFPPLGRFGFYAGAGAGVGRARMDFGSVWARNPDPAFIATLNDENTVFRAPAGVDREAERQRLRERIAGTTSTEGAALRDTLFGWQALGGVDTEVFEGAIVGIRARWAWYGAFEASDTWDQIRSHPPDNNRLPGDSGSDPVVYTQRTRDFGGLAIGFHLGLRF